MGTGYFIPKVKKGCPDVAQRVMTTPSSTGSRHVYRRTGVTQGMLSNDNEVTLEINSKKETGKSHMWKLRNTPK